MSIPSIADEWLSCGPTALLVIDMQLAIDDPIWSRAGPRNNISAEANIARLLSTWRSRGWQIFHIRHDSRDSNSSFLPDGPGAPFKPETAPHADEIVLSKHTANAFLSTDIDLRLKALRIQRLVVSGVITNNSVESTVRMASEIGYDVVVVEDATFTFARRDRRGRLWPAEDVHALSLANLEQGDYAQIARTSDVCGDP